MSQQTTTSINLGTGDAGAERLKSYKLFIRTKGYTSFSAYIIDVMDREAGLAIPKPGRGRPVGSNLED